jgi:uncharacterized membrane protein
MSESWAGSTERSSRSLKWLLISYALILLASVSIRPLWVDEVVQLTITTSSSLSSMIKTIPINPGATPLGYLTQHPFVRAFGLSAFSSRFPSIVFSVISCWLLARVCQTLQVPRAVVTLAIGIFMFLPTQFRYAAEGRPYAEGLCFSILCVLVLTLFLRDPAPAWGAAYGLSLVAAVYTQPYAILPACGISIWMIMIQAQARQWRNALGNALPLVIAVVAFLPWFLYATKTWSTGIQVGQFHFNWTSSVVLDVFKSITGGSFVCSAVFIFLAVLGSRSDHLSFTASKQLHPRTALIAAAVFASVGAVACDAIAGYFFASRQLLFAVPALAVLAACGIHQIWTSNRRLISAILGAVLLLESIRIDGAYLLHFKENWPLAAQEVAEAAGKGYCVDLVGRQVSIALYSLFVPGIEDRVCNSAPPLASKVALVSSIYTNPSELEAARVEFQRLGFARRETSSQGGTTVDLEERTGVPAP